MKLLDKISKRDNLIKSWKSLTKRPFSYGFDKVTIEQFREGLDGHLEEIQKQVQRAEYKFYPLRLYLAKKKDGGYRPIKIPTVRDRVLQKAIYDTIYPYLNTKYKIDNPASYAYIKSRKIEDAATRILRLRDEGYRYCCKADIVKFFERVDKKSLLELVTDALPDDSINHLIEAAISNDIDSVDYIYYERKTGKAYKYDQLAGIAQGSPLSPMFANLFLHGFDDYMTKQGFIMIRYADDMLFLCKNTSDAERAYRLAHEYLKTINLELYPLRDDIPGELWKKDGKYSYVRSLENLEFLGLRFSSGKVYPANSSYKNVMKEIRGVAYSRSISFIKKIQSINSRVEGWTSAFSYTTEETQRLQTLDASLEKVLAAMLTKHGLKRKDEQRSVTKIFGLPTFQQASSEARKPKGVKETSEKRQ